MKIDMKELTGLHELTGCDSGEYAFILDGISLQAIEDEDNGFRSYLNEFRTTPEPIINRFSSHEVKGSIIDDKDFSGIEFIDVVTQKVVLKIGTDYSLDYYPSIWFYWAPENLAINKDVKE